jgi:hypothetical protein
MFISTCDVVLNLGSLGPHYCSECRESTASELHFHYHLIAVQGVFGMATRRRYYLSCLSCGIGTSLPDAEVRSICKKDPIPFMHRHGMKIVLAFVIMVSAFAIYMEKTRR